MVALLNLGLLWWHAELLTVALLLLLTTSLCKHEKTVCSVIRLMRAERILSFLLLRRAIGIVGLAVEVWLDVGVLLGLGCRGRHVEVIVSLAVSTCSHSSAVEVQSTWGCATTLERVVQSL